MNPVTKTNFVVFPALDWIATLTTHIPNKGEQLVRYYGYYSNVSRGKRKNPEGVETSWKLDIIEVNPPPISKEMKKRWSYFISFIDQPDVIKTILQHLGLWEESQAPRGRDPAIKKITIVFPKCSEGLLPSVFYPDLP